MMCKFKHCLWISQIIQQRKYTLLTSFLFHRLTVLFINNLPFPSVQKVFQKENRHYNKIFSK